MSGTPVIEVIDVSKRYGSRIAVDDISFSVERGIVYGFLGPNGAGKTTTIKMILGLTRKDTGTIRISDLNIDTDLSGALRKIGAIVENPCFYTYLSGRKNLDNFASLSGGGVDKAWIDELVEFVGLGKRQHDKVQSYSLGMKQRLGIAQALVHKPDVVVLDEPTNGLDPIGVKQMRDLIRGLAERSKVTVFLSSHLLGRSSRSATGSASSMRES